MTEEKLKCCVVRDLLPSYIEGLTEAETASMVQEHLDGCADCRQIEQDMRHTVPVQKSPKRELHFLKRIKRTRLLAAILSAVVALWCMWWLYDQEFHYPNTEAGRLAAVEDYIPLPEDSSFPHGVQPGTPLQAAAWETRDNHLFIFYFAEHEENIHGIVHLVRGINGKYRILEADESPSDYNGGIYGDSLTPRGIDEPLYYLAGYNCRDIHHAEVEFIGLDYDGTEPYYAVKSFSLSGENFLHIMNQKELEQELGFVEKELIGLHINQVKLFDKDGEEITGAYRAPLSESWGSGKGTAETFLVYVYIGIAALLGLAFIRYFLRRD
ncbi:MAG: zf-HC2 domain-containing protein [Agathobaculum sp.]|jgi:hypothetical protein|uniref:zf-HC2 domain-containing protein n=1 Tax=Agathobaculum sp. TaxID=2048138 RepID=UPI003D926FB3